MPQTSLTTLDQFTFHRTLSATRGVSLIFFSSRECGSCRLWRQRLLQYAQLDPALRLFEVDAERDLALTREFEVWHLPALFLYRDGDFHCALECAAHTAALAQAIQTALAAPAQELP